jgi:hypothetical protein
MAKGRDVIEHERLLKVCLLLFSGGTKISGYLHVMIGGSDTQQNRTEDSGCGTQILQNKGVIISKRGAWQ